MMIRFLSFAVVIRNITLLKNSSNYFNFTITLAASNRYIISLADYN